MRKKMIKKNNLSKKKIENAKVQVKKENGASKEEQKIFNLEKDQDNDLVLASPKARKFARELGVDVNRIEGSQLKGRVNEADIKKFISSKVTSVETPKIDPEKVVQEKKKIKIAQTNKNNKNRSIILSKNLKFFIIKKHNRYHHLV